MSIDPGQIIFRRQDALTAGALVDAHPLKRGARRLEKRLLALCVAVWTKPVRWLATASRWLQHVGDNSSSDALKLITLLLGIPCFHLSYFCFKVAYAIQLRRLRLAGGGALFDCLEQESKKLDGPAAKRLSIAQTYHRLSDLYRCTQACSTGGNLGDDHGDPSADMVEATIQPPREQHPAGLRTREDATMPLTWTHFRLIDVHVAVIDEDHRIEISEWFLPTGSVFHVAMGFCGLGADPTLEGAKWIAETHPKVTKLLNALAAA